MTTSCYTLGSVAENNTTSPRNYKVNGYIKDLGLNWMDFHARQYDPQLGRLLGVDPKATSGGQDMFSPYAAMGNARESMAHPNGERMTNGKASDPELNARAISTGDRENTDGRGIAGSLGGGFNIGGGGLTKKITTR